MDWPFADPRNVAVFTSKKIVAGDEWIYYVAHDEDDGAWQFHPPGQPTSEADASVVSLATIVELDPTIRDLADLPPGWCAWRETRSSSWQRKQQ